MRATVVILSKVETAAIGPKNLMRANVVILSKALRGPHTPGALP